MQHSGGEDAFEVLKKKAAGVVSRGLALAEGPAKPLRVPVNGATKEDAQVRGRPAVQTSRLVWL